MNMKTDEWMRRNVGPLAAKVAALNVCFGDDKPKETPKGFRRKKGERHESDWGWVN